MGMASQAHRALVWQLLLPALLVSAVFAENQRPPAPPQALEVMTGAPAGEQAVANAVIGAYSLETEYWRDPRRFRTWDELYAYYRQGFSDDIAEQMTEFTLEDGGDMATWVPSAVHVVDHGDAFALAWFATPTDFRQGIWGFERYMVVRLRREDGRWVVYWAADSATPPEP